jgi:hypothetical protein
MKKHTNKVVLTISLLNLTCNIGMMQKKETTLAIIAIVSALGLLGLVVTESISIPQQHLAPASCSVSSHAFNVSKGRCLHNGNFTTD